MAETKIHEFDPVIYPRKLWVCVNATKESLCTTFEFDGTEAGIEESLRKNSAAVCSVTRISDDSVGVLVFTAHKAWLIGSVIAHESVHVADYYFEGLSMTAQTFECGNEPYAYLVGWAAKCINQARISK